MDFVKQIFAVGFFDEATSEQIASRYGDERGQNYGAGHEPAVLATIAAFPNLDAATVRQFINAKYQHVDTTKVLAELMD